jgi:hypothetical protein
MATYTLTALKDLVRNQINQISGISPSFTSTEGTAAYDAATLECGFVFPADDDSDKDAKYRWLAQRMRRWYIFRLLERHSLHAFDAGTLRVSKIIQNLAMQIEKLDAEFQQAQGEVPVLSASSNIFGTGSLVSGSGIYDDAIGQPYLGDDDKT